VRLNVRKWHKGELDRSFSNFRNQGISGHLSFGLLAAALALQRLTAFPISQLLLAPNRTTNVVAFYWRAIATRQPRSIPMDPMPVLSRYGDVAHRPERQAGKLQVRPGEPGVHFRHRGEGFS
jgi:hypothetical protein